MANPDNLDAYRSSPHPDDAPRDVTRIQEVCAWGVLCVFAGAVWFLRRRGPAMAMEESMMIQAPMRMLHGAVIGRDLDYFYGPVSLWIPAAFYKVAAPTLLVERFVGACYLAVLGVALYVIGRRWSYVIGLAMGGIAILVGGLSITALPITGAIALLVCALACSVSRCSTRIRPWLVGFALAFAVGLRPDFLLWSLVLLGVLTVLGAERLRTWIAFGIGLFPYGLVVIRGGWSSTFTMFVTDGLKVSSERSLPFHLDAANRGVMVVIAAASLVAACVLGGMQRKSTRGLALLGLGVIGLCLVPEYAQRADGIHVVYVTMVPLATLVLVLYEVAGRIRTFATRDLIRHIGALGVCALLLFGVQPKFLARSTLRDLRFVSHGGLSYTAKTAQGEWYFSNAKSAAAHQRLADAAEHLARTRAVLFVGPLNLAQTSYSDGSFYTLLAQFSQSTRFYDFHPRVALVYGSRLAADVRAADVLVLCDVGFHEGNLSRERGSEEANNVVKSTFDDVAHSGNCHLYAKRLATARVHGTPKG